MRPRPFSVLLAFTVLSAVARGAEPPATELPLTLAEALERARTASPRLAELRALEEASAAAARGAKADRGPSLGLSAAYSRNSNVPEFSVTQIDGSQLLVFPNLPNQGYLRANLGQPLYTGGRVKGALEGAEAQQIAAGKDRLAGQSDLRLEVTAAFWRLVGRRASERVLREAIASYESHLKDTTNLLEVGMAAGNDVLAVQVERDRAELARLEAESGAEIENANLVRLMDLPADTIVRPIEEGGAANEAGPSGDSGAGPSLNGTGGQVGQGHEGGAGTATLVELGVGTAALVGEALDKRPDVSALRARVAAAAAQVKVVRAAGRPQASLQASYDYAYPNQRIFPLAGEWRDTWSVSVGLSYMAFDGGRTSAATARACAQADAATQQLRDLEHRVRLEIATRLQELRTARASLEVATRGVEAAREDVRVSQDRYRAGVSPSSDLLDAETRLLRVGLDRTLAAADLQVARARLDRARGI